LAVLRLDRHSLQPARLRRGAKLKSPQGSGSQEKSKEERFMKTAQLFAAALVTLSGLAMLAQQADASAQQDASAAQASAQTTSNVVEMRPVNGELVNKLDAKSAKAGDQVVVKTTESVKTADGVVIPKGSRLVGSVTEVQAHGADSADSHVGIRFDHAELKGGQTLAIQSEIRSLSLPVSAMSSGSMGGDASLGTMGGGSPMGGGGAMGGGARGGTAGGPAGGALGGAANTAGRTTGTLDPAVNGTAQASGQVAGAGSKVGAGGVVHSTGVPGVMLSGRGSAASSASGTLWSSKQNVHLDGGTQIVLGVAADAH
jgi:hypothetical protein